MHLVSIYKTGFEMDESGNGAVADIEKSMAPWGKELLVQTLVFESGMRLARLRIREGRRFTVVDLDAATVDWLNATLRRALAATDVPLHPATD
jgi:hypothetical protein